ncbi:MAG: GH25 family lysozyme [bacterium]|nr:GH25 family lysozyme [bacterium]
MKNYKLYKTKNKIAYKIPAKDKRKRNIIIAGVGAIAIMSSIFVYSKLTDVKSNNENENYVGYYDVLPNFNTKVKEDNFVVLNAGDYNTQGTLFQDLKMSYCNKHDISLGVIIKTDAKTVLDIYNDIDYCKSLIAKYKLDFPIYLNIDEIMENDSLNTSQKSKLVECFINKARENGFCYGLHGKDSNLSNFNNYCFNISGFNIYLKMDSNTVKYTGDYQILEDLDGNIKSKVDYEKIISKSKLNQKENFIKDAYYIVEEGDTIDDIALSFDMSVKDLLEYNELDEKDICAGILLNIPNKLCISEKLLNDDICDTYIKKGVDLSYCQENVDWDKLSTKIDFAILKISEGTRKDNMFEEHLSNCDDRSIPIGVYFITRAKSVLELTNEVNTLIKFLDGRDLVYPIYIDFEKDVNVYKEDGYDRLDDMLSTFKNIVMQNGYKPGIYCSKSNYCSIYNSTENNFLDDFETWVAGTKTYDEPCDIDSILDPGCEFTYQDLTARCNMRQVSESAKNSGAGNYCGCVDLNYCYTDYENEDYEVQCEIKNIDKFNGYDKLINAGQGILVVLTATSIIVLKKKNKSKKNTVRLHF